MEEVKNRIAEALQLRGMLPVELARASGIGKGSISKYLKGTVIPKQNAIGAMARALNVSPAWLLGYDLTTDGKLPARIDEHALTEANKARLYAYYQALLETQKEDSYGDT